MNIIEFNKVKNFTYHEYCDYLQQKYGIGRANYMTPAYNPVAKCKRTSEGLFAHHKYEDTAILLSTKAEAMQHPFEYQLAENIVYCDYLEHLLLHVLIVSHPSPNKVSNNIVGYGGVVNFIVPELNDLYSGWVPNQQWKINCWNLVKDDRDVYFEILKMFSKGKHYYGIRTLLTSFNHQFGLWDIKNNTDLFNMMIGELE